MRKIVGDKPGRRFAVHMSALAFFGKPLLLF